VIATESQRPLGYFRSWTRKRASCCPDLTSFNSAVSLFKAGALAVIAWSVHFTLNLPLLKS
jgi:hypothetical protein